MNRKETKAVIAVMQAYVDGKEIEYQPRGALGWAVCGDDTGPPGWQWDSSTYRVKPQTVRYRPYLYKSISGYAVTLISDQIPWDNISKGVSFVRWLGDWQEVEV